MRAFMLTTRPNIRRYRAVRTHVPSTSVLALGEDDEKTA